MVTNNKKAIVVGSGIGGLAISIRLAVQGFQVTVYEKNNTVGGKIGSFKLDDFIFDSGPSLFVQPQNIEDLFTLAQEDINDYFTYKPVNVSCNYFYENGKTVSAFCNTELFAEELKAKLGEDCSAIKKYLSNAEKNYQNIGSIFLNKSLHKSKTWFHKSILKAITSLKLTYLFNTLANYNKSIFKTKDAAQLFNRFATYNGSSPYKAPAMLSLIPHIELNEGVYYPKGGMISIIQALYKLAIKKGVQFVFNTSVLRIIHHQNKVLGVVANDENILADVVICNTDVQFTYKHLLQNESKLKKLQRQEPSSSAVVFYWGIKKQFKQLDLHNIFFSNDYKTEFESIFKKKSISTDNTIYINITSKLDATHAPTNNENWFVMINTPANTNQNWETIIKKLREQAITKLSKMLNTNIEELIIAEEILTPITIEQNTNATYGSIYGNSSNSRLAAFFRHPNFSKTIKGLFFCGGTVHPGGGIPLCLKSAKIVSDLIASQKNQSIDTTIS